MRFYVEPRRLNSPCGARVMTRVHTHTRHPKATIPDAARKVLMQVLMEGGKMEHDSSGAGDLSVTRLK